MKRFYYKIEKQTRRYYGGLNVRAAVYTVCKGRIEYIGSCEWCTSSFPGESSAVFQYLMDVGRIPRKWESSSVCEWRGAGYFEGPVCDHYSIEQLGGGES